MSFKTELRELTIRSITKLNNLNNLINELQAHQKNYYKPTFDEMMQELKDESYAIKTATANKLNELATAYKEEKSDKLAPKGSDLTDDIKLFKSGIILTGKELNTLFDKYNDNNTMKRIISEYAEKNNVDSFQRSIDTELTYHEAADRLVSYAKNALNHEDYAKLITDDRSFSQITPECMKED